jgi:predicted nucleotidyltransferase
MLPLIESHRAEIAELCRRFHVQRLDVFGSAARGTDFDPDRSDVDLLVTYDPGTPAPSLAEYFDLRDELAALFGRPVDLVMSGAVRNPFILANIERSRRIVYAA